MLNMEGVASLVLGLIDHSEKLKTSISDLVACVVESIKTCPSIHGIMLCFFVVA